MATKGVYQGNVRRGIYLPEELLNEMADYARRHQVSFNEVVRVAGQALLELERQGITVRSAGIAFDGMPDRPEPT